MTLNLERDCKIKRRKFEIQKLFIGGKVYSALDVVKLANDLNMTTQQVSKYVERLKEKTAEEILEIQN